MVARTKGLLVVFGLREVQVFSEVAAGERESWMVQEVVLSLCVFNGKAVACSLVGHRGSGVRSGAVCARGVDRGWVPSLVVGVF